MVESFSGDNFPSDVAVDASCHEGRDMAEPLEMMKSLPQATRGAQQSDAAPSPVWIARYQRSAAGEGYATIECPECLGTFPQALIGAIQPVSKAG